MTECTTFALAPCENVTFTCQCGCVLEATGDLDDLFAIDVPVDETNLGVRMRVFGDTFVLSHVRLLFNSFWFMTQLAMVTRSHSHNTTFISQHSAMIFPNSALLKAMIIRCKQCRLIQIALINLALCCDHRAIADGAPRVKFPMIVNSGCDITTRCECIDLMGFKILNECWCGFAVLL